MAVFVWSIYNGATFYIDIFGKRFQNELEQLKKDVVKWQSSPEIVTSPDLTPKVLDEATTPVVVQSADKIEHEWRKGINQIPMLDSRIEPAVDQDENVEGLRERKQLK